MFERFINRRKRTLVARFSNKRWRTTTLVDGRKVVLQGVDDEGRYSGELREVPEWWLCLWYREVEHIPTETFVSRKTRKAV